MPEFNTKYCTNSLIPFSFVSLLLSIFSYAFNKFSLIAIVKCLWWCNHCLMFKKPLWVLAKFLSFIVLLTRSTRQFLLFGTFYICIDFSACAVRNTLQNGDRKCQCLSVNEIKQNIRIEDSKFTCVIIMPNITTTYLWTETLSAQRLALTSSSRLHDSVRNNSPRSEPVGNVRTKKKKKNAWSL